MKVETQEEQHVFEAEVSLNGLDPKAVLVELYADGINGGASVRQEMQRIDKSTGLYRAAVSAVRPAADYTARIVPRCDGVAVPLEESRIMWGPRGEF
jgi:starch phosphorylase